MYESLSMHSCLILFFFVFFLFLSLADEIKLLIITENASRARDGGRWHGASSDLMSRSIIIHGTDAEVANVACSNELSAEYVSSRHSTLSTGH